MQQFEESSLLVCKFAMDTVFNSGKERENPRSSGSKKTKSGSGANMGWGRKMQGTCVKTLIRKEKHRNGWVMKFVAHQP